LQEVATTAWQGGEIDENAHMGHSKQSMQRSQTYANKTTNLRLFERADRGMDIFGVCRATKSLDTQDFRID
jgi:hypothetical protein